MRQTQTREATLTQTHWQRNEAKAESCVCVLKRTTLNFTPK